MTIITVIVGFVILQLVSDWFVMDLFADYREKRVQKKIIKNFHKHKTTFEELTNYAQNIALKEEINFLPNNQFYSNFSGYNYHPYILNNPDSIFRHYNFYRDSMSLSFEDWKKEFGMVDWDILPNRLGKEVYEDTTYYSYNWFWDFEGNKTNEHFSKFLMLSNINEQQLFQLQKLVQKVNCQSIKIHKDKIFISFTEYSSFYHYGYYINYPYTFFEDILTNYEPYVELPFTNIHKIDSMIYVAEWKNGMYCGQTLY